MSATLSIQGYSDKNNPEFQKHFKAVKFCIENELSFPQETSDFFKGKIDGGGLEDFTSQGILQEIEEGVPVTIPLKWDEETYYRAIINVADIPKNVSTIIVELT